MYVCSCAYGDVVLMCVHACVNAGICVCMCACVCECGHVCVHVCMHLSACVFEDVCSLVRSMLSAHVYCL
jgi:hypothetical protein